MHFVQPAYQEIDDDEMFSLVRPSNIESPEQLTGLMESLDTDVGRCVCERGVLKVPGQFMSIRSHVIRYHLLSRPQTGVCRRLHCRREWRRVHPMPRTALRYSVRHRDRYRPKLRP